MRTYSAKPSEIQRRWHLVDAEGMTLGRMAARIATVLQGKHKPMYTPHLDTGDFVVVVNAEKVVVTGRKAEQKRYYYHTGFPGGLRETTYLEMQANHPDRIIRFAVKRMLPKTKLGRQMLTKLKIHAGPSHTHEAQAPQPIDLSKI